MAIGLFVAVLLLPLELAADTPFIGAPEPPKPPRESPLTAEEQLATFSVPPGFAVELVAAEPDGGKFVALSFDHAGRMWTMTAFEYPLDANETPAEAKALFARGGRDRALVFDTPTAPGRQKARAFAEGLAIPLGLLPYRNGAFVQYDGEIRFYEDTDGDGRADKFKPVLTGFGIEDSHLFPHQFTRAPGGWVLMAQGAFNYSKVKSGIGDVTDYNKTKLARFTPDGKRFEIIGWGPCNIWGLVLDRLGEIFIQEANDQGWPMMPFLEGASYPLCGDDVPRPYAPPFPKTGEQEMGGTGLSGLALSEGDDSFPGVYRDIFYVANPITGRIQSIRLHRGVESAAASTRPPSNPSTRPHANGWRLEHLPAFVRCGDPWFRPVAMQFGPDGCLYIVDWYNKIISHNEVPRNHPERDKTRGRIWRVKHKDAKPFDDPNFTKLSGQQLLAKLSDKSLYQTHLAWQAIVDRDLTTLVTPLRKSAGNGNIPALWALEGLHAIDPELLTQMTHHDDRNVRREGLRAISDADVPVEQAIQLLKLLDKENDPEVRAQIIRTAGHYNDERAVATIAQFALPSLDGPTMPSTHNGRIIKTREAYEREFQRYLVRLMLERHPATTAKFLASLAAEKLPAENRLLLALALEPKTSASVVAKLLPAVKRAPSDEELLRMAQFPSEPGVAEALKSMLRSSDALQALIRVRSKFNSAALTPILTEAAKQLWSMDENARQ